MTYSKKPDRGSAKKSAKKCEKVRKIERNCEKIENFGHTLQDPSKGFNSLSCIDLAKCLLAK
jgi:hypothetical protein